VDVLGQQALLAQLHELPRSDEQRDRAASILSQTVSTVRAVRDSFQSFHAASTAESDFVSGLPVHVAQGVRDVRKSQVDFHHFSDTVVITVSLASPTGDLCLPISGVLDALAATCFMQLASLGAGFSVRGGVEVGLATRMGEGEVYGPVLVQRPANPLSNESGRSTRRTAVPPRRLPPLGCPQAGPAPISRCAGESSGRTDPARVS